LFPKLFRRQQRLSITMLEKSRLNPPRCSAPAGESAESGFSIGFQESLFVSAEDFDGIGLLAGIDTCASNYWWMPELYGPDSAADGSMGSLQGRLADAVRADRGQATRWGIAPLAGTPARKTAAA
jgi:hypothetical protein